MFDVLNSGMTAASHNYTGSLPHRGVISTHHLARLSLGFRCAVPGRPLGSSVPPRRERKRYRGREETGVQLRFFHFASQAKLAREAEWFLSIVGLTHTQLKPTGQLFEEFSSV